MLSVELVDFLVEGGPLLWRRKLFGEFFSADDHVVLVELDRRGASVAVSMGVELNQCVLFGDFLCALSLLPLTFGVFRFLLSQTLSCFPVVLALFLVLFRSIVDGPAIDEFGRIIDLGVVGFLVLLVLNLGVLVEFDDLEFP